MCDQSYTTVLLLAAPFRNLPCVLDKGQSDRQTHPLFFQGCVATCSRYALQIHTINAHLITSIRLSGHETIRSLAFHEREYTPIPILAAGCSDGSIVLRTWNTHSTPPGAKARWELSTLRVLKCRKEGHDYPSVESLKFNGCVFIASTRWTMLTYHIKVVNHSITGIALVMYTSGMEISSCNRVYRSNRIQCPPHLQF